MNLEFIEKEFDLDIAECDAFFEKESSLFDIDILESFGTGDVKGFLESSSESFKEKIKKFFSKILESIKTFFKKLKDVMIDRIEKFQLNRKLAEIKNLMAQKRSKLLTKTVKITDIRRYKKYYTDFINAYSDKLKEGYSREFKTIQEYEAWRTTMLRELSDFNYILTDEEQWKLSVAVSNAIKLTDEQAKNRDNDLKMVEEEGSAAVKKLERLYNGASESFVNTEGINLELFRMKRSFIGQVCSKISQAIKTVARFISKHLFLCVSILIALLIAT